MRVKRLGVKVPLSMGEETRQLLLNTKLLDINCKIIAEDGHLILPLLPDVPLSVVERTIGATHFEVTHHNFSLQSDRPRTLAEVLADKLPPDRLHLLPRAFDVVGDIAILEIPPELNEFAPLIGESFLSLHKHVKTVLAKKGPISGVTRLREFEFLAGENKTQTIHVEYGIRIEVDLSKVFFTPRLLEEHHRVAMLVQPEEHVLDMFTGVGPFALHIAREQYADVVAVDINTDALYFITRNIDLNKHQLLGSIIPVCMDVRDYVDHATIEFDRVIMNHPSQSDAFIPWACKALGRAGIIHYYSFANAPDHEEHVAKTIRYLVSMTHHDVLDIPFVRKVRDVAPYEYQVVADVVIGREK